MTQEFTIGVEEEYQIVDAQTRALKPRGSRLLHQLPGEIEEQAANELFSSQIEIGTTICNSLSDIRGELARLRGAVIKTAQQNGDLILASSTHPFAMPQNEQITPKARYLNMAEDYQYLAREFLICGCHVHIGISDQEMAIEVMNRARGWLAPLVALAANSPFWQGEETGYASFRTEVWRRWPMAGSPQVFSSRAEYDALVRTLIETDSISDETKIYWDIRPADRFQTLEFRATDVCLSLDEAVMIAGLVRALARTCHEQAITDAERGAVFIPTRPELLRAAEWRAARYGIGGELIDVRAGKSVAARELIENFLQFLRPALEDDGDWQEVSELVIRVLENGNGAMRQRKAYEKNARFEDVVDYIAQQTAQGIET
jgi:carboxylate-amine ligase